MEQVVERAAARDEQKAACRLLMKYSYELPKFPAGKTFTNNITNNCRLQLPAHTLVLRSRRWRRYDPPKRRFNRPHLHGATRQKTAFFIVTAVKTSNPTNLHPVLKELPSKRGIFRLSLSGSRGQIWLRSCL
jgi:hypothetical protein